MCCSPPRVKDSGFRLNMAPAKTHFLAALVDLLMWRELGLWNSFRDDELKNEYSAALSKVRMFPVAFSLRGMGESNGKDSLMRIFEEQIRESLDLHDPALAAQVKLTSADIADAWYANEASSALKAAVRTFFQEEHTCTPEDFRSKQGPKKFGQELVRSTIPEGRLKGKFKERFALYLRPDYQDRELRWHHLRR